MNVVVRVIVMLAMGLAVLSASRGASAQPGLAPARAQAWTRSRDVTATLSSAPLTPLTCTVQTKKYGVVARFTWEPGDVDGLERSASITLPADGTDPLVKSCAADPIVLTSSSSVVYLYFSAETEGLVTTVAPKELITAKDATVAKNVKLTVTWTEGAPRDASTPSLQVALAPVAPGRSLDLASGIATELLTVLAEIAVDKAKNGAFELVRSNVEKALCEKLVWTDAAKKALHMPDAKEKTPVFPATCDAVRRLRLQDLTASAQIFSQAVIDDVLSILVVRASVDVPVKALAPLLRPLVRLGLDVALRDVPADRAAQTLLAQLAAVDWVGALDPNMTGAPLLAACGVDLAFETLSFCSQHRDQCEPEKLPALLGDLVTKPPAGACNALADELKADLDPWIHIVQLGLEIVTPRPDATPRTIAKNVVAVAFTIARTTTSCTSGSTSDVCANLADFQQVIEAVLAKEISTAVMAGARLIERNVKGTADPHSDFAKVLSIITKVSGTVTAYAATYGVEATTQEQKKQLHEERKKAIEGLIDAFTDRSERGKDFVVSLGTVPGIAGGWQYDTTKKEHHGALPGLTIPLGVTFSWLPEAHQLSGGGLIHLSGLDIAQFLSATEDEIAEPTWANFAMVGAMMGGLIGTSSSAIFIGVDVRYAPALFASSDDPTDGGGAFRLQAVLGYPVSFIDFN